MDDLFTRLKGRGEEDFFTECLAMTLERDEALRRAFVRELFSLSLGNLDLEAAEVKVRTQALYVGADGRQSRPDMEFFIDGRLKFGVENKISSPEGEGQLRKYLSLGVYQSLAFVTARRVSAVELDVLTHPAYQHPAGRDQFLWRDFYALVRDAANSEGLPFTRALLALFDAYGFLPLPPFSGKAFPEEGASDNTIRQHYASLFGPARTALATHGWITPGSEPSPPPYPRLGQLYSNASTSPISRAHQVAVFVRREEMSENGWVELRVTPTDSADAPVVERALFDALSPRYPDVRVKPERQARTIIVASAPLANLAEVDKGIDECIGLFAKVGLDSLPTALLVLRPTPE